MKIRAASTVIAFSLFLFNNIYFKPELLMIQMLQNDTTGTLYLTGSDLRNQKFQSANLLGLTGTLEK